MIALAPFGPAGASLTAEAQDCDGEAVAVIVMRKFSNRDRAMAGPNRDIVILDLGGVLIDRDPRHHYRKRSARAGNPAGGSPRARATSLAG